MYEDNSGLLAMSSPVTHWMTVGGSMVMLFQCLQNCPLARCLERQRGLD